MPKSDFDKLVELMDKLREPGGCPWDREQTAASLKPYIIEEAYEVVEAIDNPDQNILKEELGDLLFQTLFLARIAKEKKLFDIYDVLRYAYQKMVNRHPHVFGKKTLKTAEAVLQNWERIKRKEKGNSQQSIFEGLPKNLPALIKAHRVQDRVSRVGFDWEHIEPALAKVEEELAEFKASISHNQLDRAQEELGDLFFALVNVARFMKADPEQTLHRTVDKFIHRFAYIEKKVARSGKKFDEFTLEQLDKFWEEAKKTELKNGKRKSTSLRRKRN
ncbi:MAG: nucleoside triphosphate pyrophosphohydrolase [bacterium]|nr:nucleoside triphosphate pyrophosphohydrolase [bacterium]